jgi:hypothetical protein
MTVVLEVVLVTGQRRRVTLPGPTDTVANALDRLDVWVATDDGGWVQKSSIVEVRPYQEPATSGGDIEYQQLTDAAGKLADNAER